MALKRAASTFSSWGPRSATRGAALVAPTLSTAAVSSSSGRPNLPCNTTTANKANRKVATPDATSARSGCIAVGERAEHDRPAVGDVGEQLSEALFHRVPIVGRRVELQAAPVHLREAAGELRAIVGARRAQAGLELRGEHRVELQLGEELFEALLG